MKKGVRKYILEAVSNGSLADVIVVIRGTKRDSNQIRCDRSRLRLNTKQVPTGKTNRCVGEAWSGADGRQYR